MSSLNPRADIYDPKTLAVPSVRRHLDVLRAYDPFRNSYNDSELRIAIGQVGGLPQNRRFT